MDTECCCCCAVCITSDGPLLPQRPSFPLTTSCSTSQPQHRRRNSSVGSLWRALQPQSRSGVVVRDPRTRGRAPELGYVPTGNNSNLLGYSPHSPSWPQSDLRCLADRNAECPWACQLRRVGEEVMFTEGRLAPSCPRTRYQYFTSFGR